MRERLHLKLVVLFMLLALLLAGPVAAQEGDGVQDSAGDPAPTVPLLLYTDYPAQVIGIDDTATLALKLRSGTDAQVVGLSVTELPEEWQASFRGGGQIVRAVYVTPGEEASVTLRIEPPADVAPGEYNFTVRAEGDGTEAELPVELIVQERVPARLAWEVELPTLRGQPDTTFRYNATLVNEGGEDLVVDLTAETPPGFVATFQSGGQEVISVPLAADQSERINVEVQPLTEAAVGTYPITVLARGGEAEATMELAAEVVGQASLALTTPSRRLSGEAEAGVATTYTLLLQNSGSAPARNIEMSSSAPNGWEITFEPETVPELPPGQQQEVTARVQPPENAIAGDYVVTFRARPDEAGNDSIEYRVTVRTSTLWGIAGVGLIAIAILVVGIAVSRFGRR